MKNRDWTDAELIEMLQEQLPQELSPAQIDALRAGIRRNTDLRQALLDELKIETGVAMHLAPEPQQPDAFIERLEQLVAAKRRGRWMWFGLILLLSASLIGGTAWILNRPTTPPITTQQLAQNDGKQDDDGAKDDTKRGDDTDTGDATTARVDTTGATGDDAARIAEATAPDPPPPPTVVRAADAPPDFDPPWRLYDDPAGRGDHRWLARVERVLQPIGGAQFQLNDRENYFTVNGRYHLAPPAADGRVVRLRTQNEQRMVFDFEAGNETARIEMLPDRRLAGFRVTRKTAPAHARRGLPEGIDNIFLRQSIVDRVDKQIDFKWNGGSPGMRVPGTNFAVYWSGKLLVPRKGEYRFFTTSDDGTRLTVNGRGVVHNWAQQSAATRDGRVMLDAGEHDIALEFFQGEGDAVCKLEWEGPDIKRQVIPSSALRAGGKPGLLGRYCFGPPLDTDDGQTVEFVGDDGWKWRHLRSGALDLRYQDGRVVVARGGVVLLTVPMSKPPQRAVAELRSRLNYVEQLRLEPLPLSESELTTLDAESKVVWRLEPMQPNDQAELKADPNGVVHAKRLKGEGEYRAIGQFDYAAGAQVTFRVTGASSGTGIFCTAPSNGHRNIIYLNERGDQRVLAHHPTDHGEFQRRLKRGWLVGETFHARFTYGLDNLTIDFSQDGVHWARFHQHPFYGEDRPVDPHATFGLWLTYGKGERHVTIDSVRIRRFGAIERLADAAVVDQLPLADLAEVSSISGDARVTQLLDAAPKKIDADNWRAAWLSAMLHRPCRVPLRREAAITLVEDAIARGAPFDAVLPALVELPQRIWFNTDESQPRNWRRLRAMYDQLAQRQWARQKRDDLGKLIDTWYRQDLGPGLRDTTMQYIAPIRLTRLRQFDLLGRDAHTDLLREALRYDYITRSGSGWGHDQERNGVTMQLSSWMLAQAMAKAPDAPKAVNDGRDRRARRWPAHPLVVDTDRESINTIAEFLAAVETDAIDHACRILTRRSFPDGLAQTGGDGKLFKSTYVLLRQTIDEHATLASKIKDEYEQMGLLRLRRAIDDNRWEDIESLATQFRGTAGATQALAILADRDLSMGNFFAAAARYEALLDQVEEELRPTIAAKRRLAMAMTGEQVGEPVTQSVELPGQTLDPNQFEGLVRSLLRERRIGVALEAVPAPNNMPAPSARPMKLTRVTDLNPPNNLRRDRSHRAAEFGYAFDDGRLLLHQHARVQAIDTASRRVLWRYEAKSDNLSSSYARPATPLVAGEHVYLVFYRDRRTELTCLNLKDGKPVWRESFDDDVIGEPILVGPWLYVLSVRRELGDYGDLILRRISPATGESVLSERLVRMRYGESLFRVGRPALVGDALVFRTGGALVCCDLLGRTRWIRRLPFVPPQAYPTLFESQSLDDLIVHDGRYVIVSSPGSPTVASIDARSGEAQWTYVQPMLRRVVGSADGVLLVSVVDHLEGLDLETGKLLWHVPESASPGAITMADRGTVMSLTLDEVSPRERRRTPGAREVRIARWRDVKDGTVVREFGLPEHERDIYEAQHLLSDGKRLITITNVVARGNNPKAVLSTIEPDKNGSRAADANNANDSNETPVLLLNSLDKKQLKWSDWHAVGPFQSNSFNNAYHNIFPPEQKIDLNAQFEGGKLKWDKQPDWQDGQVHELSGHNVANYLYRTVESPADGTVTLSLGSDDAIKVWVNGEPVLQHLIGRGVAPDQERVKIALRKGQNRVLMKIVNGPDDTGFYFAVK